MSQFGGIWNGEWDGVWQGGEGGGPTFANMAMVTTGQGSLVGTLTVNEVPAAPPQGGSGKQAQAEWDARQKWDKAALDRLAELAYAPEAQPAPRKAPQKAADAPVAASEPPELVPVPVRDSDPLAWLQALLAQAELAEAQALEAALLARDRERIVQAAMEAEAAYMAFEEQEMAGVLLAMMEVA